MIWLKRVKLGLRRPFRYRKQRNQSRPTLIEVRKLTSPKEIVQLANKNNNNCLSLITDFLARMSRNRAAEETDKQTRIAIVSSDKCKPKRCRQECKKSCPVVRMGKLCIEVAMDSKIASLSEELCIGCGICVKVSWWKLVLGWGG